MDALGDNGKDVIVQGLTVGIIENGLIVEYWFRGGTDVGHLVQKESDMLSEVYNSLTLKVNDD